MIYYAAVPLTLAVVVLQIAAAPAFRYAGVHPDLPVVWLSCWAVVRGRSDRLGQGGVSEVLPLILTAGLGLGWLGPEPLGASLLALLPIAGIAFLDELRPLPSRFWLALATALVCGTLFVLIDALAGFAGGQPLGGLRNVIQVAPRVGVLDALAAALVYWPVWALARRQRQRGAFRRT